jgi:hypothetical protein
MVHYRYLTAAFTIAAALAFGRGSAAADPIQITSGQITVTGVQDLFSRGFLRSIFFDFATEDFQMSGGEGDGPPQDVFEPRLSSPVTLTVPGESPELVHVSSDLSVSATPSLTPTSFVLFGTLTFFELATASPLFTAEVSGTGTATWQFVPTPTGSLIVSGANYEFAPVPEPMTLLLVGGGLAGVAATRRRRTDRR